jgi:hypothetical protein
MSAACAHGLRCQTGMGGVVRITRATHGRCPGPRLSEWPLASAMRMLLARIEWAAYLD